MKFVLKYKFIIVILILIVLMLPFVLVQETDSKNDAIITAVGIDKKDEEYEISFQYIIPAAENEFKQKLEIISAKDKQISEAVAKITLKLGKFMGLTHCQVVVVNNEAAKDNLIKVYDYGARFKLNTNNITLLNTPDSAKDFLTSISELENDIFFSLSNESMFADGFMLGTQTNLSMFYNDYFSPARTSKIAIIDMVEEEASSGGSSSGKESSDSGSSGGGESKKKKIENKGRMAVIKRGKKILELDTEQTFNFNWFNAKATVGYFSVTNVDDQIYKDATVGFEMKSKNTKVKVFFEQGKPVYELNLTLNCRITEVSQDPASLANYDFEREYINETLKQAIVNKIKQQTAQAVDIAKTNSFDLFNVYENFYKYKTKEFKEFLQSLANADDYIQEVEFRVNVDIKPNM